MKERAHGVFGRWGPKHPHLAEWGARTAVPAMSRLLARNGIHRPDSEPGRAQRAALEARIRDGCAAYVLGFNTASHNTGAALVRVTEQGAVELICNEEEERYSAIKSCDQYPEHSVEAVKRRMGELGVAPEELVACVSSWDYAGWFEVAFVRPTLEEAPASLTVLFKERTAVEASRARSSNGRLERPAERERVTALVDAPERLGRELGLGRHMPIVGMRHHDSHAYLSYAVSPFGREREEPVIVIVTDGAGDDCALSLYVCRDGRLTLLRAPGTSRYDSLGAMYGFLSSTQGGWPEGSSEGRYMGAAAWGDGSRLTNRYYRRLKHMFHFGAGGEVRINRTLAGWTRHSLAKPYSRQLVDILGEPIPHEQLWNPDAILNVEDVRHPEATRERVDKAAAVQMVYEDALVHIVDDAIRTTGSHRLVLTGGTALNCVANMRLMECFGERWYERNLGLRDTSLHVWVPPIPGDAGTPVGAAYAFAMQAGARPGTPLRHAFYCGRVPSTPAIRVAVRAEPATGQLDLGDCSQAAVLTQVADLLAYLIAGDGVMGIYQGASETGPRALGHRSILANPCNPETRRVLNERVKHRELIRPLAPMLTRAAAERYFHLEEGACDDDYNAYNYMVLTAKARPEAHAAIPAVIHHDGTGRIQIVRPDVDPLCHEYLLAMGRRAGVEASVNTSLNVGAPIAHTPEQALATLRRARGMDGLLMVGEDRHATLVWLEDRAELCERLMGAIEAWARETGSELLDRATLTRP